MACILSWYLEQPNNLGSSSTMLKSNFFFLKRKEKSAGLGPMKKVLNLLGPSSIKKFPVAPQVWSFDAVAETLKKKIYCNLAYLLPLRIDVGSQATFHVDKKKGIRYIDDAKLFQ